MYYTTFLTVDGDFICSKCGTVVKEYDKNYSLEQIEELFIFDSAGLKLTWEGTPRDETFYTDGKPKFSKTWKDAILELWEVIEYIGLTNQELIKRVLENEFRDMNALVKMISNSK